MSGKEDTYTRSRCFGNLFELVEDVLYCEGFGFEQG